MLRRSTKLCLPGCQAMARRGYFGPSLPSFPRAVVNEMQRRMSDLERDFFNPRWSPFGHFRPSFYKDIADTDYFHNPIVEENGVKKFKLEFDVSRFKPDDVKVSTNKEDSTLTVEAKYKDDNSSFQYSRKLSIPEGVVPAEITCKYTPEGTLVFEAPYTEPPNTKPIKDQAIDIKHN